MSIASVDGNLPTDRVLVGNSLTPGVVHQNSNKERWKVIELKSDILHDVVTVKITDESILGFGHVSQPSKKIESWEMVGKKAGI